MSLKLTDLSVLAYANNFTLWHYVTPDADIATKGYLDHTADMVRVNDLIIANVDTAGSPKTKFYIVTGNTGGSVTVSVYS